MQFAKKITVFILNVEFIIVPFLQLPNRYKNFIQDLFLPL